MYTVTMQATRPWQPLQHGNAYSAIISDVPWRIYRWLLSRILRVCFCPVGSMVHILSVSPHPCVFSMLNCWEGHANQTSVSHMEICGWFDRVQTPAKNNLTRTCPKDLCQLQCAEQPFRCKTKWDDYNYVIWSSVTTRGKTRPVQSQSNPLDANYNDTALIHLCWFLYLTVP